jgi:adenine-specific DNA-methyltransferase
MDAASDKWATAERKARGAFFTPPPIADFLVNWAVRDAGTKVLDPTCGESVFLLAAGRRLRDLGCELNGLDERVYGVDLHSPSLEASMELLEAEGLDAHLIAHNFFDVATPDALGSPLPLMDAVVGNPPFVRYQDHRGDDRKLSAQAALRQGVRLTGLASSWAALVVHASAFLKPNGRLAMVLPAELLTVHYAESVRRWLRQRFRGVTLVMFERLQFDDALERVVLLLAHGSGGCESFSIVYANDAAELSQLLLGDAVGVMPAAEGKWTDLLLPLDHRQLYRRVVDEHFTPLSTYGLPELGTVTGANHFFTMSEETRVSAALTESQVRPICPPGTKHLHGLSFTKADWTEQRHAGERVWMLYPDALDRSRPLQRYVKHGEAEGVNDAYKCSIRTPWWRPPLVAAPDLFFTYMSHRYPRLITNSAGVSFVNSMHGVRLRRSAPRVAKTALPLLLLNSVTMLGAEVLGRSYGGGILKMEPREAAELPMPDASALEAAWHVLKPEREQLDRQLHDGRWVGVAKRVDEVLLQEVMGVGPAEAAELHQAAALLRERRITH